MPFSFVQFRIFRAMDSFCPFVVYIVVRLRCCHEEYYETDKKK